MKTEADILADTYQMVRRLSKYYIQETLKVDTSKRYELNGISLNSAHWIMAHLVWTEDSLLCHGLGKQGFDIPWLETFAYGTENLVNNNWPSIEEILEKMDLVHKQALSNIRELSDLQLNEPNAFNEYFGGKNDKRSIIMHAIRHEPMHTGQLSWIIKLGGGPSIA